MLVYKIGESEEKLYITDTVLNHIASFKQQTFFSKEAGGQLFARREGSNLYIELATGPRVTDKRFRTHYVPEISASQKEIYEQFKNGLHFIGNWHTHPEKKPNPSSIDIDTMKECFLTATQEGLWGFVLIIVGTENFPLGLHVSVHNGNDWYVLDDIEPN